MKTLYITYDGLTDPLGSSQIIPYMKGLAASGCEITILSAEKPQRLQERKSIIEKTLLDSNIKWVPIAYHKNPPVLSTVCDLVQMRRLAVKLMKINDFKVVHCRSYIAALVGLKLKRRFGLKFIFDMRGFWADERVDGKLWPQSSPLYRKIYNYFKIREREFVTESDVIVSLTEAGKQDMLTWGLAVDDKKIQVIPCCADLSKFSYAKQDHEKVLKLKETLGAKKLIFTYLGSIGTWYLLDEMLDFFKFIKTKFPHAFLYIITPDAAPPIITKAQNHGLELQDLLVQMVSPENVPLHLAASHIGLFFIKPAYSKMASSPVKMGEMLAAGLPLISNAGIGDSDHFFKNENIGLLLHDFSKAEFERAAGQIDQLLKMDKNQLNITAKKLFSLESGVKKYRDIYNSL